MYPFAQTIDVSTTDEESCNGVACPTTPKTNGRTPLTSTHKKQESIPWIDENTPRRATVTNLRPAINGTVRTHFAPRLVGCISRSLRPVFIFLRLLSLFPVVIQRGSNRRRKRWRRLTTTIVLFNIAVVLILFNLFLCNMNFSMILIYIEQFGLMHALTVSTIITGMKPMLAAFLIGIFTFRIKTHTRLIRLIDAIDLSFRSAFRASPPVRRYAFSFFALSLFFFMVPFAYRVIEFYYTEQRVGDNIMNDVGFIVVPLLTVWNVVPLMYYCLHNKIVRFYLNILMNALDKEHQRRMFSLKFFYEQFLRITVIQEGLGTFFNPYVLFSLAWSMFVLCLTIYFITQPHSSLVEPITAEQYTNPEERAIVNKSVRFLIGWATLQVVVALLHIAMICRTGMQTNETTRQIVNAVLRVVPDTNADLDRFQISCFVHKLTTQHMWGMTVWRAFPLERSTFFTLVSVIVTYSFLLLKLKDNPAVSPITRAIYISSAANLTDHVLE